MSYIVYTRTIIDPYILDEAIIKELVLYTFNDLNAFSECILKVYPCCTQDKQKKFMNVKSFRIPLSDLVQFVTLEMVVKVFRTLNASTLMHIC